MSAAQRNVAFVNEQVNVIVKSRNFIINSLVFIQFCILPACVFFFFFVTVI